MTVPGMKFSLIPKANRKAIYEYLFKEGVIVVQKNGKIERHPEVPVPNLHVMMTLRSLQTKKFVEEKFNWQHNYYFLTNEGIEFLRTYLHLPPTVFPSTLTKKSTGRPTRGAGEGMGEGGDMNGDWRPRGGFGRGRGRMGDRPDRAERAPRYA
ncbi:ribosomal protein RPS10 [Toxoplasma gondii TgCatPRC2]|uniref:Ribosomal protein RPS10 n=15 Tax=Toxoplasma gondii TaxID=5811 RepID=B9PX63_TOXGV|nr:ribosomal protein RPS10 [Toxoplasma gondii ME49]5XXU_K Chain K, Ribosomal protein eS10 [Toxoplasma gondii]EPR59254.1 ribosomal protein RPS10 [Toxoplasma gondii GT1]ESS30187.1 ribosomal protein RPS10 [Toxoplasma gondii VEG]KFG29928.1 ribosomal protein RPS10 [Toxoplasma gondii GAB2-2007-GAL-DOM2]KFG37245.1 ribosomal protein RPS10 [Toxoplasma gondii FOU]KFG47507.1 ribosomal protein RPS10 [Toxoplasma gondii p89]KFH03141.1 ribosomal protein RPS10 [Toxoplasma gondii MAS]KFH06351.1 ribosomal pr|eukprot:XP_002371608.1 ribosomal protein RPS10 [Toxoplasma gondii ME49]